MGHKVNPKAFRIGTSVNWNSRWFANGKKYSSRLRDDVVIRKFIETKLKEASLDKVEIDRGADSLEINIYTGRPGVIIGKGGAGIDDLKSHIIKDIVKNKKIKIQINIKEVVKPGLSARIIAQSAAIDIEKRMPFRRVMKKYIEQVMKAGGKGVKIVVSGRLGGADIARREVLAQGKIPLHTIRADIDYARLAARTTYGAIGVKVWICKGEFFSKVASLEEERDTKPKFRK
jgi:small subunit ribosomal protein S3